MKRESALKIVKIVCSTDCAANLLRWYFFLRRKQHRRVHKWHVISRPRIAGAMRLNKKKKNSNDLQYNCWWIDSNAKTQNRFHFLVLHKMNSSSYFGSLSVCWRWLSRKCNTKLTLVISFSLLWNTATIQLELNSEWMNLNSFWFFSVLYTKYRSEMSEASEHDLIKDSWVQSNLSFCQIYKNRFVRLLHVTRDYCMWIKTNSPALVNYNWYRKSGFMPLCTFANLMKDFCNFFLRFHHKCSMSTA